MHNNICPPAFGKANGVATPQQAAPGYLAPDRYDRVDFDRRTERQDGHADRAARMAARLAEQRHHQLGRAVGNLWLNGESGGGIDEHAKLDDARDAAEIAPQCNLDLRDQHQRRRGDVRPGRSRIIEEDTTPHRSQDAGQAAG